MKSPLATTVAIITGLIILVAYFVPALQPIQRILLNWAMILLGIAGLVGIINLLAVHWQKMASRNPRNYYSPLLLLSFIVVFVYGLLFPPDRIVVSVQMPVESALLAMLAISLTYTSLRLLGRRRDIMTIVFVASTVVFLFISSGLLGVGKGVPFLGDFLAAINELPVAGARGILIGVALGSLTTGLRLLFGADRPYSG
jgi:hypothetical protein